MPLLHPNVHQSQTKSTYSLVTTPVTNACLSFISLNDQDILKIMYSLNVNKAHGYDDMSIRLLKICDNNCLQSGSFPNNWKKSNAVPIHKKGDKQLLQNYRPVVKSLRELFSTLSSNISKKNSLLCPNQSGFCPFHSFENQLLSIVYDIYANFDQHLTLEVRANFLDISKAFGKVWHEGF